MFTASNHHLDCWRFRRSFIQQNRKNMCNHEICDSIHV